MMMMMITNNNCRHSAAAAAARPSSREIFPSRLHAAVWRAPPRAIYGPGVHGVTARWLSRALGAYIFTIVHRKCRSTERCMLGSHLSAAVSDESLRNCGGAQ